MPVKCCVTSTHAPVLRATFFLRLLHSFAVSQIVSLEAASLKAKLHYTDTGYEHRLRTSPTDKLTTILQQM